MNKMTKTFIIYLALFTVVLANKCLYKSAVMSILKHEYLKVAESGVGTCIMDGGKTRLFKKFKCMSDSCERCVRLNDVYKVKDDCEKFYTMKDADRKPVEKKGCLSLQSIDSILQYEHRMSQNYPCILREGRTRLFEEYACAKHSDDIEAGGSIKDVECFYCMKKKHIDVMVDNCKKYYKFGDDDDDPEHHDDGHHDDDDGDMEH